MTMERGDFVVESLTATSGDIEHNLLRAAKVQAVDYVEDASRCHRIDSKRDFVS